MSYDIATNPVAQEPYLGKLTQPLWYQNAESENGHLDFQFDSSVSGTKNKYRTVINQLTSFILFTIFMELDRRIQTNMQRKGKIKI